MQSIKPPSDQPSSKLRECSLRSPGRLLRHRPLRQFAEERQPDPFAVGRLIKHVNPTAQDGKFQAARHSPPGGNAGKAEERADGDINEKPDNEQIEALERMEADAAIFPEALRGQEDERRHPAGERHVTER